MQRGRLGGIPPPAHIPNSGRWTEADFRGKLLLLYFGFTFVQTCVPPTYSR
jgi:hypothetical protein